MMRINQLKMVGCCTNEFCFKKEFDRQMRMNVPATILVYDVVEIAYLLIPLGKHPSFYVVFILIENIARERNNDEED